MPKILFYPIDVTYKVKDSKAVIFLFGRAADGRTICIIDDDFRPYFWVLLKKGENMDHFRKYAEGLREKEKDEILNVEKTEAKRKKYLGEDLDVVRITVNQPAAVVKFRDVMARRKEVSMVLEADIPYARRYLIDKKITPAVLHEVDGEETKEKVKCDYIIKARKIEQISEDAMKPKILAFDIETYNPMGDR